MCVICIESFFETLSHSRSARQCLMIRTDTTRDQDYGTESDCVRICIVHCLSLSDNKCGFSTLLLLRGSQLWCKTREQKRKDPQNSNTELQFNASFPNHSLALKRRASALFVIITHARTRSYRRSLASLSIHKISRCILPLLCTSPLLCFLHLMS